MSPAEVLASVESAVTRKFVFGWLTPPETNCNSESPAYMSLYVPGTCMLLMSSKTQRAVTPRGTSVPTGASGVPGAAAKVCTPANPNKFHSRAVKSLPGSATSLE